MKITARRKTLTMAYMVGIMSLTLLTPPAITPAGEPMINLAASHTTLTPSAAPSPSAPESPGDTTEPEAPETTSPDQPTEPVSPESEPTQPVPDTPSTGAPQPDTPSTPDEPSTPKTQQRQAPSTALLADCQTYPPTTFQVCGRIRDKYNQTGGPAGFLLYPKSNELTNPGNTGKRSEFIGGNIYWSAATDAHPVAHEFLTKWGEKGYETGYLKYPTTDEIVLSDGVNRRQEYQGGSIYWAAGIGAHTIQGAIKDKWDSIDSYRGWLGFPTSDEKVAPDGQGRYNTFQNGSLYWSPTTGAHPVNSVIMEKWAQDGYEAGTWGYPTADPIVNRTTHVVSQQFQGGTITISVDDMIDLPYTPANGSAQYCNFQQKVDRVHISNSVSVPTASAHGAWQNIDCPAGWTATITTQLQAKNIVDGTWHDVGSPGIKSGLYSGGGSSNGRSPANFPCSDGGTTVDYTPWRAWADVDIEGHADTGGKVYSDQVTHLQCDAGFW